MTEYRRVVVSPFLLHGHGASGRKLLDSVPATPLTGSSDGHRGIPIHGPYSLNETTFDSNLVVILAALLCALICALGLNSVLRCALRCSRRMVFESSDDLAVRLANTGLKKSAMKALPTIVYGSQLPMVDHTDCPICLAEFVNGEHVRVLPKCNHCFHVECIDKWLLSHSSCPTCRHCLLNVCDKKSQAATMRCDNSQAGENNVMHIIIEQQPTGVETNQVVDVSNRVAESGESRVQRVAEEASPASSDSAKDSDLEASRSPS
eukprot:Gb_14775 [translate_table: standard]